MNKYLTMCLAALLLSACDSHEEKSKPAKAEEATQHQDSRHKDNALLKLQDDTVEKTKNAINAAADKQKAALDAIDK